MVMRYWPLHLNAAMRATGHRLGECPVCERVWFEEQINLPIGPSFDEDMIVSVVDAVVEGLQRCGQ
jgi:dTDP-4-amino-4,6-dideoxygalactose transaminase